MLKSKKHSIYILALSTFISSCVLGQVSHRESLYLFHLNPFRQVRPNIPINKRPLKTRIDFGVVLGMYSNDPHYTNGTAAQGGYTIGVKEEIPVLMLSSILLGFDFYKQNLSFNSYYFAKGYSFLYIPSQEIYNHSIAIDEIHIPLEYKFSFGSEYRNRRTFYGLIGWVYRLLIYDNALVTSTENGAFIFEGQNNLTYKYHLFTPIGSSVIEAGLGYQRNVIKNGNAFFIELDYNYGISPLHYSGNGFGSNSIDFTLNTVAIKIGLRL